LSYEIVVPLAFTNPVPSNCTCLVPIEVATVVAKLGSSPKAAANSFSVSKVVGDESTRLLIAVVTYVCVAKDPVAEFKTNALACCPSTVSALVAYEEVPVVFWFQVGTAPVRPEYGIDDALKAYEALVTVPNSVCAVVAYEALKA